MAFARPITRSRHGTRRTVSAAGGLLGAAAVVAALGFLPACRRGPPPHARHVVLVTVDTLRADRVGVYGGPAGLTPELDRIAHTGAMADHAMSHVPLTRPSHICLLTGLLPWQHGVRDNNSPGDLPDVPMLAEVLKDQGFSTAAFISSVVLSGRGGLARGFDVYADHFEDVPGTRFAGTLRKRGDRTLAEALEWLGAQNGAERRLFLWLHLYDVHDPCEPPEPFATRFALRPYDGAVAWTDELVGRLDRALGSLHLADQSLLVVGSDHGEGLGEHGEENHGFFVYESTLAVPLILRGPGIVAGRRLERVVGLVDLYPTILDLASVPLPPRARPPGHSLAAALRGGPESDEHPIYAESLIPLLHFGWSDLRVLRDGRWKYIEAPRPELYDLTVDPGEQHNLSAAQADRRERLRGSLNGVLVAERRRAAAVAEPASVPLEELEKLGALGYLGGAAHDDEKGRGADPKDKIEEFRVASDLMKDGLVRLRDKDYTGSAARMEELLRRGIESFEAHLYLAQSLAALGRPREAADHYRKAARRAPQLIEAWEGCASALLAAGDARGAIATLREARTMMPSEASLAERMADVWLHLGQRGEARRALEDALPLAPRDADLRRRLGELLRDLGDVPGSIARLQEAVALDPTDAVAWNSLGTTLGGAARLTEAEAAFREAMSHNSRDHLYVYNLGLTLLRQGRRSEARTYFEKALSLEPAFKPARDRLEDLSAPVPSSNR